MACFVPSSGKEIVSTINPDNDTANYKLIHIFKISLQYLFIFKKRNYSATALQRCTAPFKATHTRRIRGIKVTENTPDWLLRYLNIIAILSFYELEGKNKLGKHGVGVVPHKEQILFKHDGHEDPCCPLAPRV